MRSIEDAVNEITEMILREQAVLKSFGEDHELGKAANGAIEALYELKEWILEL